MRHFAVLNLCWYLSPTELLLYVHTSAPVHLWTFYTDVEPRRHLKSRVVRGVELPWDTYFCFVAWKMLEQDEPGDTLEHTFTWIDWPACLTRWFTHRGTVAGEWSPSAGPIFKYHYQDLPWRTFFTETWECPAPPPPLPAFTLSFTEHWTPP